MLSNLFEDVNPRDLKILVILFMEMVLCKVTKNTLVWISQVSDVTHKRVYLGIRNLNIKYTHSNDILFLQKYMAKYV